MSAYVLSNEDLNVLVRAGIRWKLITRASADLVGQALLAENIASVTYRYKDVVGVMGEMPGPIGLHPVVRADATYAWITPSWYRYVPRCQGEPRLERGDVRIMIQRYLYQTCEHPTWLTSAAKAYCDELARRVGEGL